MSLCRGRSARAGNTFFAAFIMLLLAIAPGRVLALVINVTGPGSQFSNTFGPPVSSPDVTQAQLLGLLNAAGDFWEGILDSTTPRTVNIQAGFSTRLGTSVLAATAGGNPATLAVIAFARNAPWFVDPTPLDNSEFTTFTEKTADLGGGTMSVSRKFTGGTGAAAETDMFTTALHEIGHALGLSPLFFFSHGLDAPILIDDPLPFAGSEIPIRNAHINIVDALMSPSIGSGERELPSDADILVTAQAGGFTEVILPALVAVDEPAELFLVAAASLFAFGARRRAAAAA